MERTTIIFESIVNKLKENRNTEIGQRMEQYMRNQFAYFGVPSPKRKILFQGFKSDVKLLNEKELQILINRLWNEPQRECQYVGLLCLEQHLKNLSPEFLPFLESLITSKSWWDTVDWLAANPCGQLFKKFPSEQDNYVYDWIESHNLWLQRTAIIFQLKYSEQTDFSLMTNFIQRKTGVKEFFIQKACGWALRQYSKYSPSEVSGFIQDHPELSHLAKTEGLKWLKRNKNST